MDNKITILGPNKNFEGIKKIDENGIEYWEARELLPILGYKKWEKAEEVITRAARACINSGQDLDNHFHQTGKMVEIGSNTVRKIKDIGGVLPEHLPTEKHIKEIKKDIKKLGKAERK